MWWAANFQHFDDHKTLLQTSPSSPARSQPYDLILLRIAAVRLAHRIKPLANVYLTLAKSKSPASLMLAGSPPPPFAREIVSSYFHLYFHVSFLPISKYEEGG